MGTDQIMYCIIALILGMLMYHILKNVCGCKNVIEGQETWRYLGKYHNKYRIQYLWKEVEPLMAKNPELPSEKCPDRVALCTHLKEDSAERTAGFANPVSDKIGGSVRDEHSCAYRNPSEIDPVTGEHQLSTLRDCAHTCTNPHLTEWIKNKCGADQNWPYPVGVEKFSFVGSAGGDDVRYIDCSDYADQCLQEDGHTDKQWVHIMSPDQSNQDQAELRLLEGTVTDLCPKTCENTREPCRWVQDWATHPRTMCDWEFTDGLDNVECLKYPTALDTPSKYQIPLNSVQTHGR